MSAPLSAVLDTIAFIYASVGAPSRLGEVVGRVRALIDGSKAILLTPDRDPAAGGFNVADGFDPMVLFQYRAENWNEMEPWLNAAMHKGLIKTGAVLTDEMLMPQEELRKRAFFNEVMVPHETDRVCAAIVNADAGTPLPVTILSVFRGPNGTPYSEEERRMLALVSPHLLQALNLTYRLASADACAASAEAAIEALRHALVLLDDRGRVLFVNREARTCCVEGAGVRLSLHADGRCTLQAHLRSEDAALQRAIHMALCRGDTDFELTAPGPLMLHGRSPDNSLVVSVSPLARVADWPGIDAARACVTIDRPYQSRSPSAEMLVAAFDLTPAECRLARALASGLKPKAAAVHLTLSESTVRTQIRSLLEKTNSSDLGGLAALWPRIA